MTLSLLPAAALLVSALCCVLLEVAGTPPGFRKRTTRVHLPWLVGLGGVACVGIAVWARLHGALDLPAAVGCIVIGALVAVGHAAAAAPLRALDEERGEMSAMFLVFGAGTCVACVATDLPLFAAGLVLSFVPAALLAAPDRDGPHGIEAAARLSVFGIVLLALLVCAAALSVWAHDSVQLRALATLDSDVARVSVALVTLVVWSLLGVVPLHQRFVDVAHGSSSASAGLLTAASMIVGGVFGGRVLSGAAASEAGSATLTSTLLLAGALTLVAAPLAALAQVRVGRLVAYLAATQGGLICVALATAPADAVLTATVISALTCATALLGVTLATQHPAATWEDWAGYGRHRPVVAAVFLYALASCAGLPATPGFVVRVLTARAAFFAGAPAVGLLCIVGSTLAAAPVVRLALFLFAKERAHNARSSTPPALAFFAMAGVLVVLTVWPEGLAFLFRLLTRSV